jgi:hypothetical protein
LESLALQLCTQPLNANSFAIDRLGTEPLTVSCALDLIPSSLFLEMMTTPSVHEKNAIMGFVLVKLAQG